MKPVRKAVFPVAGLGTRFLPATKAIPKEMLTVVDRPLIQYAVDEAREAGIEHFVFVTGRNKGVIEDHFDRMFELDTTLEARGNKKAEQEILTANQPAAATYDAVYLLRDVIARVGTERRAVREALAVVGRETPPYIGAAGRVAFDTLGDLTTGDVHIAVVRGGGVVPARAR